MKLCLFFIGWLSTSIALLLGLYLNNLFLIVITCCLFLFYLLFGIFNINFLIKSRNE